MQETLWVYWQCRSVFSRLRLLKSANLWQPLDDNMADSVAEPEENTAREYLESLAVILNPYEYKALQMMAEGYKPDEMAKALNIKLHSAIQLRYRILTKMRQKYGKLNGS
jgi:DNA-binding CsgD family transcriptional regulator